MRTIAKDQCNQGKEGDGYNELEWWHQDVKYFLQR